MNRKETSYIINASKNIVCCFKSDKTKASYRVTKITQEKNYKFSVILRRVYYFK